jgi:hypothetical protein
MQAAARANHQKIVPIDSEIYQAIKALYISRGLALPSTTGPWSEDELLRMLAKISPENLLPGEKAAYDYAWGELNREHGIAKFSFDATIEAHAHTNTEDFQTADDYIRPWNYEKPFFTIDFEAWITKYGYGLAEFSLGNRVFNSDTAVNATGRSYLNSPFYGTDAFGVNIPMVPPAGMDDLDFSFPYRGFVSIGGEGWSIVVGRDRLSWGPGESGNFLVGGHVQYHDNMRTSWYGDNIKYTFSMSRFPWVGEYYKTDENDDGPLFQPQGTDYQTFFKGISLYLAHRIEWRMWRDKLNFAFTESVMYENPDGAIDPLIFSPTIMFHNIAKSKNLNSLLGVEADYTVIPHLNIYAQLVVDEFRIPGEPETNPDGLGYMLGAKTALPLGMGMFNASLEGAYTTPYLYIRSKLQPDNHQGYGDKDTIGADEWGGNGGLGNYPLGFVVATRYYDTTAGGIYAEDFMGYRWGGDAIVVNANAGYRVFGQWNAKANFLLMFHGTNDKWTNWRRFPEWDPKPLQTPTTDAQELGPEYETPANLADSDVSDRKAVAITTALSLAGEWNLPWVPGLSVFGQGDFILVFNKDNIPDNTAFDAQFTAGVSYKF